MSIPTNYADGEVQGLSRYLPTTLSKTLIVALVPSAASAFLIVRQNPEWFSMQSYTPEHQTALAIAVALGTIIVLAFLIILDLAHVFAQRKHRRFVHYSNVHPHMSWRWLIDNAAFKHWSALTGIIGMAVCIGYCIGCIWRP